MNLRKALEVAALTAATVLTRFVFRSHYLYDIDSVNFALALKHFDPAVHQPHPPGYFLYICLGRLANMVFHDANTALVAVGIVFSCGAVAMVYCMADCWFGRSAASFAGLIFLFSPLVWFHGIVALTYIVEAFFSALVGYLCWRVYEGAGRFALPGAVAMGIACGFRPSSILFLGPLLLFSLSAVSRKRAAGTLAALSLTIVAWFIPMVGLGGFRAYTASLMSLWLTVPAKVSVFNSSILNSFVRATVIAGVYLLCFGCAAVLPWIRSRPSAGHRPRIVFTRVWMAPGLLFFTFIYLKTVNSGYLLVLTPPVCAWMGFEASRWYANPRIPNLRKMSVVGCCIAVNTLIFLRAPVYCSYGEVRRFERELGDILRVLPQIAPAKDTLIVGLDSHFLGYRHVGYYLPDYFTVQFPEVRLAAGMRVFAMRDRDTSLEKNLATDSARNFVLFPLPLGDSEYTEYMAMVRSRLPSADLRPIVRGGHEFIVGPVGDLPLLFPVSAGPALSSVHQR